MIARGTHSKLGNKFASQSLLFFKVLVKDVSTTLRILKKGNYPKKGQQNSHKSFTKLASLQGLASKFLRENALFLFVFRCTSVAHSESPPLSTINNCVYRYTSLIERAHRSTQDAVHHPFTLLGRKGPELTSPDAHIDCRYTIYHQYSSTTASE